MFKQNKKIYNTFGKKAVFIGIAFAMILGAFLPIANSQLQLKDVPESENQKILINPHLNQLREDLNPSPLDIFDPWWNPDWIYRKEIIINHSKVDEDLSNFPVLVSISSDDNLSNPDQCQIDGDDIVFTDDNGIKLSHEIEFFDNSSGELVAWVKIPSLSSNMNTSLYMYYGNPSCTNQEEISNTWNSNFVLVQHLDETIGIHYDSTINSNGGTYNGSNQNLYGMIDGADGFDGSIEWIDCGNDDSLDITDEITIEAWVNRTGDGFGSYPGILSRALSTKRYQLRYRPADSQVQFFLGNGTDYYILGSDSDLSLNTWTHVVGTWDGSTMLLFVDGVQQTDIGSFNGTMSFTNEILEIGRYTESNYFQGGIDEIRVSNILRNSNWISTEYNNQYDPSSFYVIGNQEIYIPSDEPFVSDENPENNSEGITIGNVSLSVLIKDSQGDNMDVTFRTNASGTWTNIGINSSVTNGTYSQDYTFNNYGTDYWWSVNVTDSLGSGNWTNKTYVFTTQLPPTVHMFTIDSTAHIDYGCSYPVTYVFNISTESKNLKAYKCGGDNWTLLPNKNQSEIQNGIEAARFDYTSNKAYISVAFPDEFDVLILKITDENDTIVDTIYDGITKYYDNKKMAVVMTIDDWYERYHEYFMTAIDRCQLRNIWFTPGIVTVGSAVYGGTPANRTDMQNQLDEGFVEPASHSKYHLHTPYDEEQWGVQSSYDEEINGSKQNLIEDLDFPNISKRGDQEYLYAWIEPYGNIDNVVRQKLGEFKYICDRSTASSDTFSSWDDTNGLYNRVGFSISIESVRNLTTLNNKFNSVYNAGGIYHMFGHARNNDLISGDVALHLDYISNRSDVWYVGFGHLYLYHYMQEKNAINHTTTFGNLKPYLSSESPVNGSTNYPIGNVQMKIQAFDIDNNIMNITFFTNASGSWEAIGSNNSVSNGFYQQVYLFSDYSTTYWWSVNCTDGINWVNETYSFTTRPENYPPIISNPIPTDGSKNVAVGDVQLGIFVSDQDNNSMNITFRTNSTGDWIDIGTNYSQKNGTYYQIYSFSEPITKYYWSVNCTDGKTWVNNTYKFTTERITAMNPFLNGWKHRKKIEINHEMVECNLTNFPVLIYISDLDLKNKAQSDGDDIIIMDGENVANLLSHEIEYYDSGNLTLWVNVTSLSSIDNTTLYMYYGNSYVINMQDPNGVWDSDYVLVQHLSETDGTYYDSTKNENNGLNYGSNHTYDGQIDGANIFDGSSDWIDCGNGETLDITDKITLEAWVKRTGDGFGNYPGIISRTGSSYNRYQLRYKPANDVSQFFLGDSSSYTIVSSNADLPIDVWTHLVGTWDGNDMILFVNGEKQTDTGSFTGSPSLSYQTLELGRYTDINYYSGGIDEVRISNLNRSSCWIKTEYNNQHDPSGFYSFGVEENALSEIIWDVKLNFSGPNMSDTLIFGESPYASDGQDSYDLPKPFQPSYPYVYAWFDANLSEPYDKLKNDYRKYPDSEKIWDMYIVYHNGGSKNITIDWEPTDLNDTEYDNIFLKDIMAEVTIDMKIFENYTYLASSGTERHFQIICNVSSLFYYSVPLSEQWNLVSLPINESVKKDRIIVNYLGVNYTWQQAVDNSTILAFIYRWDATDQTYDYSNVFLPGECYWMYAYKNCTLWVSSRTNNDDDYLTDLYEEWNLVGLPFNRPVNKNNLTITYNGTDYTWQQAVDNGIVLGFIYGWVDNTQSYELTEILVPGKGFWIYAYYNCVLRKGGS